MLDLNLSLEINMHLSNCPNCQRSLSPRVMACQSCELEIKGPFELNEFARLDAESLHFLRVFVHCEGHIRDMERALGISYPTIKAKVSSLKKLLGMASEGTVTPQVKSEPDVLPDPSMEGILGQVEGGKLSVEEALRQIRRKTGKK